MQKVGLRDALQAKTSSKSSPVPGGCLSFSVGLGLGMSRSYTGQRWVHSHSELPNSESFFFLFFLVLNMDGACVSIKPGPTASWNKTAGAPA